MVTPCRCISLPRKGSNPSETFCDVQCPGEEKFRRINLENAAFKTRVASIPSCLEFLKGLGFEEAAESKALVLSAERINSELLNAAGVLLTTALTNPMFGVL